MIVRSRFAVPHPLRTRMKAEFKITKPKTHHIKIELIHPSYFILYFILPRPTF